MLNQEFFSTNATSYYFAMNDWWINVGLSLPCHCCTGKWVKTRREIDCFMSYWFVHRFYCLVAFVLWVATIYNMSLMQNVDVKFSKSNKICIFLFYFSHYIPMVSLSGLCGLPDLETMFPCCHQCVAATKPAMMTASNGNIFRVTRPVWWNPLVTGGLRSQRPATRSCDLFFDVRLSKRLSKPSRRRWFLTPSRWLWRQCNSKITIKDIGQMGLPHYNDAIMSVMAPQITSLTIVDTTVYSGTDQRKLQSAASLAFVREIHKWLVNSPRKGPVTRKMFAFDDVIMTKLQTL